MRCAAALAVCGLAAGLLSINPAVADSADLRSQPVVSLRTGEHPGFDRVVLDVPPGVEVEMQQSGAEWRLRTIPSVPIRNDGGRLRNLLAMSIVGDVAVLTVAQGATVHRLQLPGRTVFDVTDPPLSKGPHVSPQPPVRERPVQVGHRPRPAPEVQRTEPKESAKDDSLNSQNNTLPQKPLVGSVPVTSEPLSNPSDAHADLRPPQQTLPATVLVLPDSVAATSKPRGPIALAVTLRRGAEGLELATPFGSAVGVAAFRRGTTGVVVFDEQRPIDLAALKASPALAGSTIQLLEAATVLRVPLAVTADLRLELHEAGWLIALREEPASLSAMRLHAIRPDFVHGQLHLLAEGASRVVTVPDPQSGGTLLVGTQRTAGEGVVVTRSVPDLKLLSTWQGVALEPVSDGLAMRATATEFVVEAEQPGRGLAASDSDADVKAAVEAATFSRRFDFPPLGIDALAIRLHDRIASAAATPPQSRAPRREEAAITMLAMGLPAEAGGVMDVTATDDPRAMDDPQGIGLKAIAALLAGRPAEAGGIDDPRLSGTDDVTLWRAVRRARLQEGAPEAAAVFSASVPLILAYPEPLRQRLLPLAAETMALGGEATSAARLVDAMPDMPTLRLARAMVLQNAAPPLGDPAAALKLYDILSQDPDRLVRARATRRGIEFRLTRHEITPAGAAERMEQAIDGWRGDARELDVRLRTADLHREAGNWRAALASLRETEQLWPDHAASIHAELLATFAAALMNETAHPLPPLDLVALAGENADLVPEGAAGLELARRLADRLVALDLPKRAISAFEKLVATMPPSSARSALGLSLGTLRLDSGDAAGALAALAGSTADELPSSLAEGRTLLAARAKMAQGDPAAAAALLTNVGTLAADSLLASLYEQTGDWPAAELALRRVVAGVVPAEGLLGMAAEQALVRLASAAARAGDEATLAALRLQYLARLLPSDSAKVFAVLTEAPLQGVSDLPRARSEALGVAALPAELAKVVQTLPRDGQLK